MAKTLVTTALILGVCCTLFTAFSIDGQIVAGGDGGGGIVVVEGMGGGGGGHFGLVFQLQQDNSWKQAKDSLVTKAQDGEHVGVVYALQTVSQNAEDKFKTRIDAVFAALEEADLYPLDSREIKTKVGELTKTLKNLKKGDCDAEVVSAVLMALDRAGKQIGQAQTIAESGEWPKSPSGPAGGGIMRRGRAGR